MNSLAIFGPVFVLGFWTFVVLNVLGISRIRAGRKRLVRPDDFRLGESANVPEHVRLANRNYMNLLELPQLFYAVAIIIYVTGVTSAAMVAVAWAYVGLRLVHSVIEDSQH